MPCSTHKRRRSAIRADRARGVPGNGGRCITTLYTRNGDDKCLNAIESHPFNHQLDLLLPQTTSSDTHLYDDVLAKIESFVEDTQPCLAHVPLTLFLMPKFVAQYIRSGSLCALSLTHLDSEDTVCLDGQGMLIFSLCSETYQSLGLVGRPSRFSRGASGRMGDRRSGPVSRYIVELPLLSPSFVPQKKGYERAWKCLLAWDHARAKQFPDNRRALWPFLFVWTPPSISQDEDYHGGDIQFPSDLVSAEMVQPCPLHITSDILDDVWIPQLSLPHNALEKSGRIDLFEQQASFLEYTGLASMASPRIRTYDRCDPSLAFYSVPKPCSPGLLRRIRIRGMIPSPLAMAIVKTLYGLSGSSSKTLETRSPRPSWAYASVIGFPDTPIAWRTREPGLGLGLGSGLSLHQMTPGASTASLRRGRKKGVLGRGESEHGFLRTGENGWSAILLDPEDKASAVGTMLIESLELDTYN